MYEIVVELQPTCMLKAARTYMIVTLVENLGDIIKAEPSIEALEREEFERSFTLYIASADPMETLVEQISRVGEVLDVKGKELSLERQREKVASEAAEPKAEKTETKTKCHRTGTA